MSDNYTDDDFDSEAEGSDGDVGDIKSLRRAANSKKKLEQELANLKRELAFAKAGIDLSDPKMRYFVKGYDGEMTADAVREAAMDAGFLQAQQPQQQTEQVPVSVAAAQDRVVQAAAGAISQDNSEQAALARLQAAMDEGGIEAMMDVAQQYGIPIGEG